MSAPHFIVHEANDSCAVAVVEGITAGMECEIWTMGNDATNTITVLHDIPIGHKVALDDIAEGDTIIKYGEDIGRCVAAIQRGGHLHVHNVKTKRW